MEPIKRRTVFVPPETTENREPKPPVGVISIRNCQPIQAFTMQKQAFIVQPPRPCHAHLADVRDLATSLVGVQGLEMHMSNVTQRLAKGVRENFESLPELVDAGHRQNFDAFAQAFVNSRREEVPQVKAAVIQQWESLAQPLLKRVHEFAVTPEGHALFWSLPSLLNELLAFDQRSLRAVNHGPGVHVTSAYRANMGHTLRMLGLGEPHVKGLTCPGSGVTEADQNWILANWQRQVSESHLSSIVSWIHSPDGQSYVDGAVFMDLGMPRLVLDWETHAQQKAQSGLMQVVGPSVANSSDLIPDCALLVRPKLVQVN